MQWVLSIYIAIVKTAVNNFVLKIYVTTYIYIYIYGQIYTSIHTCRYVLHRITRLCCKGKISLKFFFSPSSFSAFPCPWNSAGSHIFHITGCFPILSSVGQTQQPKDGFQAAECTGNDCPYLWLVCATWPLMGHAHDTGIRTRQIFPITRPHQETRRCLLELQALDLQAFCICIESIRQPLRATSHEQALALHC